MRLILMRHGNTFEDGETPVQIGARTDLPLTAKGLSQAKAAADYFKDTKFTAIYCGPLKRQIQTASAFGTPIITPALTELDYGPWEGLTSAEITARYPTEYAAWQQGIWPPFLPRKHYEKALHSFLGSLSDTVLCVTSNGLLQLLHPMKVKTGHFCEVSLNPLKIIHWNHPV